MWCLVWNYLQWVPPNLTVPIFDLVDVIFQLQDGGWIRCWFMKIMFIHLLRSYFIFVVDSWFVDSGECVTVELQEKGILGGKTGAATGHGGCS